jgi:hypothetical protein
MKDETKAMMNAEAELCPVWTEVGGIPAGAIPDTNRRYYVSTCGQVWKRTGRGGLMRMRPVSTSGDPPRVRLRHAGKTRRVYVHRIIGTTWGGAAEEAFLESLPAASEKGGGSCEGAGGSDA